MHTGDFSSKNCCPPGIFEWVNQIGVIGGGPTKPFNKTSCSELHKKQTLIFSIANRLD